jgi:DNA-binding MarR family transcriptional regulator
VARSNGDPETTLLYLMKQVESAVRAHLDEALRPAGVTALQYTALTVLERHPNYTSAQLARHSFVTAQTMADMVTTLEGRSLVERHRDPADRRRLVLSLTKEGRALLRKYRGEVAKLETRMLTGVAPSAARSLRQTMITCRENLDEHPRR